MDKKEYDIASIDLEIYELTTYRKNLKKYIFYELLNGNILPKKVFNIFEEIDRLTIEIYELEEKKSEIFNLLNY